MTPTVESVAWYRQGWPWFLISIPMSAVLMGILMFWLATTTNNSLVVDDYYRQGKAINADISRDHRAVELGIVATMNLSSEAADIRLNATSLGSVFKHPGKLRVKWVHSALAKNDRSDILAKAPDGAYRIRFPKPLQPGRYRVHLEPVGDAWRLVSPVIRLVDQDAISIQVKPVAAGDGKP